MDIKFGPNHQMKLKLLPLLAHYMSHLYSETCFITRFGFSVTTQTVMNNFSTSKILMKQPYVRSPVPYHKLYNR